MYNQILDMYVPMVVPLKEGQCAACGIRRERERKTPMDFESPISTAEIKMLSCFLIVKNIFDK